MTIRLWFGRLNVKWTEDLVFSEREGFAPVLRLGPVSFVWRRYREAK